MAANQHRLIVRVANLVPAIRRLRDDRDSWSARARSLEQATGDPGVPATSGTAEPPKEFPDGHFYSAIPDVEVVQREEQRIYDVGRSLPGIDINEAAQLDLLAGMRDLLASHPYDFAAAGRRYRPDNDFYSFGDGLTLHLMMRLLAPKRILEIGSGWSSAVMLDTDDAFFDSSLDLTFVDPYPERLMSLLSQGDIKRVRVLDVRAELLPQYEYDRLEDGDLLFIDSSHVSKVGSDVNRLILEVVPRLAPGVVVHVHDIFWPFDYPLEWIERGRAWSEAYLLRALLVDNPRIEIMWFSDWMHRFHQAELYAALPMTQLNPGCSIWFRTR